MSNNYRTIDDSELEDFDTECRAHGLDQKTFTLREHDIIETPLTESIFTTNGRITITRNNISRTYATGNATHWVADFSDDLRTGIFK